MLYGSGNPGGLVNLVSKEPEAGSLYEVLTRFGNNGRAEAAFDFTGPVEGNDQLLPAHRHRHPIRSRLRLFRQLARRAGSTVTWAPDNDTTLTLKASYTRDPNAALTNWMPALGTLQTNPNGQIPYDFFSGNPTTTEVDTAGDAGYEFEQHLNDTCTVRQNLRFMHNESEFKAYWSRRAPHGQVPRTAAA